MHINENFAKLAEALYISDRKAREAVETRAKLERRLAQKKKSPALLSPSLALLLETGRWQGGERGEDAEHCEGGP